MKKSVLFSAIVCVAALLTFSSCKEEEPAMREYIAITCDFPNINVDGFAGPDNDRDGITDPETKQPTRVAVATDSGAWTLALENPANSGWLVLEATQGEDTTVVGFTVAPNQTAAARSAVIIATDDNGNEDRITISQKAQ